MRLFCPATFGKFISQKQALLHYDFPMVWTKKSFEWLKRQGRAVKFSIGQGSRGIHGFPDLTISGLPRHMLSGALSCTL
jgi:hypothetical protein